MAANSRDWKLSAKPYPVAKLQISVNISCELLDLEYSPKYKVGVNIAMMDSESAKRSAPAGDEESHNERPVKKAK
jgi:hypothetical protein